MRKNQYNSTAKKVRVQIGQITNMSCQISTPIQKQLDVPDIARLVSEPTTTDQVAEN